MEKEKHCCENVFEALGFPPDEAAALHIRSGLMIELEKTLKGKKKKQQELADELGVPRTRISEIMSKKNKFSTDRLIRLLSKCGKKVELVVS